jgi:hypothetical protein
MRRLDQTQMGVNQTALLRRVDDLEHQMSMVILEIARMKNGHHKG